MSILGQPLSAEIDLVSAQQEELSTLSAHLASADAYRRSGLQLNAAATGLRFEIKKRSNGQPYIKLTSDRTVNDPFVDLLIELNWASGRLVREYTALIDPRNYAPALAFAPETPTVTPASAAATPPAVVAAVPAATVNPVALAAPTPAPESVEYGPVRRGESLSRIAVKLKPQGVSLEQMMVGILRSSPEAFINNNMNRLKAGQILNIPGAGQLAAITHSEAVKQVRLQLRPRRSVTQTAAKATPPEAQKDPQVVGKPVLRLSSGNSL